MTYSAFLKELKRLKAANRESIIKKYPEIMMGRDEFAQLLSQLAAKGITQFCVIQYPDWAGGCYHGLKLSIPEQLEAFEYIDWQGDLSKALKDRHKIFRSESNRDSMELYYNTLEEIILDNLQ